MKMNIKKTVSLLAFLLAITVVKAQKSGVVTYKETRNLGNMMAFLNSIEELKKEGQLFQTYEGKVFFREDGVVRTATMPAGPNCTLFSAQFQYHPAEDWQVIFPPMLGVPKEHSNTWRMMTNRRETGKTKKILGYKCREVIATINEPDDFVFWEAETKDLPALVTPMFSSYKFKGAVLAGSRKGDEFVATNIEFGLKDSTVFADRNNLSAYEGSKSIPVHMPEGYKEMKLAPGTKIGVGSDGKVGVIKDDGARDGKSKSTGSEKPLQLMSMDGPATGGQAIGATQFPQENSAAKVEEKPAMAAKDKIFADAIAGVGAWVGKDAPAFEATDINGNKVSMEALKGKVVVLNFWFIGCGGCVAEMPALNNLVDDYKSKGVAFYGITGIDHKASVKQFLKVRTFKYDLIAEAAQLVKSYGVRVFPLNLVIDKQGKVAYACLDANDASANKAMRDAIEACMAQ